GGRGAERQRGGGAVEALDDVGVVPDPVLALGGGLAAHHVGVVGDHGQVGGGDRGGDRAGLEQPDPLLVHRELHVQPPARGILEAAHLGGEGAEVGVGEGGRRAIAHRDLDVLDASGAVEGPAGARDRPDGGGLVA